MSDADLPEAVRAVRDATTTVPGVHDVRLAGSGATGDRTALSDWDFELAVEGADALAALEHTLSTSRALAVFWDPLSDRANLIVLLDGPTKIDLIVPDRASPVHITRWDVTPESLPRLDAHFWDWTLWLGAKELRGRRELVASELEKLHGALLEPLGAATRPASIGAAVGAYLTARDARADALGVSIDDRLGRQVRDALAAHGVLDVTLRPMGLSEAIEYRRRPANGFQRAMQAMASTRPGAWLFSKTITPVDRVAHRVSGGRFTMPEVLAGLPVIMVTTTGRRSGQARTSPLVGVPIGHDLAIVGTNFGQPATPAWVHNLEADPTARVAYRDREVTARARPATDEERAEVFRIAASIYPGYDKYQERITGRTIRIFVLEPS